MNNILRSVLMRRSTYQFDSRPIRDEELMDILEEGKLLSNAENNDAWHFTVLQNRALLTRLSDAHEKLIAREHEGLKKDSASGGAGSRMFLDVPMLLIISGRKDVKYAEDAANMVFGSMMLVAEKYGIGVCWLNSAPELFSTEDGRKVLEQMGIPVDYLPLCVGAFGYKRSAGLPDILTLGDNIINIVK
jgi:nitroreductase